MVGLVSNFRVDFVDSTTRINLQKTGIWILAVFGTSEGQIITGVIYDKL